MSTNLSQQNTATAATHYLKTFDQLKMGYLLVRVDKDKHPNDYWVEETNNHLETILRTSGQLKNGLLSGLQPELKGLFDSIDIALVLRSEYSIEKLVNYEAIKQSVYLKAFSSEENLITIIVREHTEVADYEIRLQEQTEEIQAQNEELTVTNEQLSESFDHVYQSNVKLMQKEKELKAANNMLQLVLDHIPVRVFWKDTQSQYLGCNKNFAQDAGRSHSNEVVGKFDTDLFSDSIAKIYQNDDNQVMQSGISKLSYEEPQNDSKSDALRWLRTNKVPLVDDNNQVFGVLGTYEDISDFKSIEKELVTAKERAEQSDRLKSAFLANMSHEIRTPMNGILGFGQLLKEPLLSDEDRNHYVNVINVSGQKLLAIVNDIIDISKIESGQVELHQTQVNVHELLNSAKQLFEAEAKEKALKLEIESALSEDFTILQDSTKLFQILSNLISNAIKFTEHGVITIKAQLEKDYLSISVLDTGIGISEDLHEIIFDRFNQGNTKIVNKIKGTGLGLSISKGLLQIMGGKISLSSSPNEGSKFTIELPVKKNKG
ncbi:sensor histidine kinase [Labilibacter marinus]|uniref:sensor histidine kinase n=1 Tax=Labilibacter marinus TaxID=1477105 RepID=UPI00082E4F67|nr:ATP-binding protein [Labilibacter marinus]